MLHETVRFVHSYDPEVDGDASGELVFQSVPAEEYSRVCRQRDELVKVLDVLLPAVEADSLLLEQVSDADAQLTDGMLLRARAALAAAKE